MAENVKNELKNAFKEAAQDELLNVEELNSVQGGGTNLIACKENKNCVAGCACDSSDDE